jgi:hypothetical protein
VVREVDIVIDRYVAALLRIREKLSEKLCRRGCRAVFRMGMGFVRREDYINLL